MSVDAEFMKLAFQKAIADYQENVYPTGASVQFYKIYLDEAVKAEFAEYDVVGVIEHDVVVAREDSFPQLYKSAFNGGEEYWVKGSVLAGKNFHETATVSGLWHVLGHINGNALYNNWDPAFAEFVDYTRTRWGYTLDIPGKPTQTKYRFPYDVALWATIADFPYSWPLWQRFSEKFINSHLIANVGFIDVDRSTVTDAVTRDTLFIHGSSTAGGSKKFAGAVAANLAEAFAAADGQDPSDSVEEVCKPACHAMPLPGSQQETGGLSHVCDPSCDEEVREYRFDGYLCGAGDPSLYGEGCRTCYTDEVKAVEAERRLRLGDNTDSDDGDEDRAQEGGDRHGEHVIMCDTMRPPSSPDCNSKCRIKLDTVCDHTCGTGRFGDYNCNWRDHGTDCRYCFNDEQQALKADQIAQQSGGRVIMCDTHEPPRKWTPSLALMALDKSPKTSRAAMTEKTAKRMKPSVTKKPEEMIPDVPSANRTVTPFAEDIVRHEMCAFVPGYFQFIAETEVTVQSIMQFMRGMRVVVAVHPTDLYVYQSTFGGMPDVRILQASHVNTAALLADRYCGPGTKLIYYLNAGELLSREINFKDTHSPKGDLLVVYSNEMQPTAAILGFSSPTFGPDIMLPAEINEQLREMIVAGHGSKASKAYDPEDVSYPVSLLSRISNNSVPQMLAAVAYARNPDGIWFFNPSQWVDHHLFKDQSIWAIPLVKPRFSCLLDMSLAVRGYDMGLALRKTLGFFRAGVACETGFRKLDMKTLPPNPNVEFSEATGKTMPDLKDYKISVVFSPSVGEEGLIDASLASVVKYFPSALEVVIVVGEKSALAHAGLARKYRDSAPFPVRLVPEAPSRLSGGAADVDATQERSRRRLTADEHCVGEYVLHMEPNVVVLHEITYDNVFHFEQSVVPYGRPYEGEAAHTAECRQNETARVFDEPVRYRFGTFNNNVYPREMYSQMRDFIGRIHNSTFDEVMRRPGNMWAIPGGATSCSPADRQLLLPDSEFMGAFLWYEMHDEVYWLPVDPRDKAKDGWAVDIYEFAWSCTAYHTPSTAPADAKARERYLAELARVDTPMACWQFNDRWSKA